MTALALGGTVLAVGPTAVRLLTDLSEVNTLAIALLPLAAVYVALSFAAFQLDGIFIGATATRDMRNASVLSFGAFLGITTLLIPRWGNEGLWWAFIAYVVIRAVTLGVRYGPLRRTIEA
jgi:MATE family multidrug resistance protein